MAQAFGIDIGGSGIKGAPVDVETGKLTASRLRIPTPDPSTPQSVAAVCAEIIDHFAVDRSVPIGLTFPAPIKHGVVSFIANLDRSWKGVDVAQLMDEVTGRRVVAVNDADAAGYAEVAYGAARDVRGVVLVVTLGTGIGSAIIVNGTLVPNTELGHIEIDGRDAEARAADSAREREELSWKRWGKRLTRYFSTLEMLFSPDLFVVGGGVSNEFDDWAPFVKVRTPMVPAALRNAAGIVGAARLASEGYR